MRLSTKSRYAITAMLDLALNGKEGPVTLADISENQNISLSYLEQLFSSLRAKQLVRGVRGPGGGYFLARDASAISVADIVCAVDEWVEYTRSPAYISKARDTANSSTRGLWEDLSAQLFEFLADITLASLVQRGEFSATDLPRAGRSVSGISSVAGLAACGWGGPDHRRDPDTTPAVMRCDAGRSGNTHCRRQARIGSGDLARRRNLFRLRAPETVSKPD